MLARIVDGKTFSYDKYDDLVVLKDKNSSSLIDKVYYKIDNREVKQINKNHILYYGTLEKGESKTIEVRFWLGSDLITNDDQGKKASIYIDVYGK